VSETKLFLSRIVGALQRVNIPYLVTGSVCSSLFGEARATRDIDLIIAPTETQLKEFVLDVGTEYYASLEAALEAFRNRSIFNVIDGFTSWKADLILRKNTPFELEKFKRRIRVEYLGIILEVATAEDIILSKLVWAKASQSEQQIRDVRGVVATQNERLDKDYLRFWAKDLKVEEMLEKILAEAEKLGGVMD
jgi:hypothetical protein